MQFLTLDVKSRIYLIQKLSLIFLKFRPHD